MAKFKITTPVPDWRGVVGDQQPTQFSEGCAELDVNDMVSVSRLAYFRSAGYGIEPLDDVSVEDAIRQYTMTPNEEADHLERENARLARVADLDKLRTENARLREGAAPVDDEPKATATGGRQAKGGAR